MTLISRIAGLLLIGFGLILFYLEIPAAISKGTQFVLLVTWSTILMLIAGSFLIVELGLKTLFKSLIFSAVVGVPISVIYVSPLPGDSQLLIGSLIGLSAALLLRYHQRRKQKTTNKS